MYDSLVVAKTKISSAILRFLGTRFVAPATREAPHRLGKETLQYLLPERYRHLRRKTCVGLGGAHIEIREIRCSFYSLLLQAKANPPAVAHTHRFIRAIPWPLILNSYGQAGQGTARRRDAHSRSYVGGTRGEGHRRPIYPDARAGEVLTF